MQYIFFVFFVIHVSRSHKSVSDEMAVDCNVQGMTYPVLDEPQRYLICKDGKALKVKCKGSLYYDPMREDCSLPTVVTPAANPCDSKSVKVAPVAADPSLYVICRYGEVVLMARCQEVSGQRRVFHEGKCKVTCSGSGPSPLPEGAKPGSYLECGGNGFGVVKECPKGKCFDPKQKTCTPACKRVVSYFISPSLPKGIIPKIRPFTKFGVGYTDVGMVIDCVNQFDIIPSFDNCKYMHNCTEMYRAYGMHCVSPGFVFTLEKGCVPPRQCPPAPCKKDTVELVPYDIEPSYYMLCREGKVVWNAYCKKGRRVAWEFRNGKGEEPGCYVRCQKKGDFSFNDPMCRQYVHCEEKGGISEIKTCEDGTKFDPASNTCSSTHICIPDANEDLMPI